MGSSSNLVPVSGPQAFDYARMPPPEADRLRGTRDAIRGLVADTAVNLVRIGVALCDARDLLGKKKFWKWARAELPWSREKSFRLMNVARAFGRSVENLHSFAPSALYVLSWPGVPQEARRWALEKVADGGTVTHADAKDAIARHRPRPPERPAAGPDSGPESRPKKFRPARDPVTPPADPALARDAESWRAFARLVAACGQVHLTRVVDDEYGDETVQIRAFPDEMGQPIRSVLNRDLAAAVADAADGPRTKTCGECCKPLPVARFSRNRSNADGLNGRCKGCEREREKRRKRRAGPAVSDEPAAELLARALAAPPPPTPAAAPAPSPSSPAPSGS